MLWVLSHYATMDDDAFRCYIGDLSLLSQFTEIRDESFSNCGSYKRN